MRGGMEWNDKRNREDHTGKTRSRIQVPNVTSSQKTRAVIKASTQVHSAVVTESMMDRLTILVERRGI